MFESTKKLWNNHGFEIIMVLSIVFIIILALFRIGKKGTWSPYNVYDSLRSLETKVYKGSVNKKSGPPKESSGEKECRRVLQKIFKKEFKNCRPDFLLNPVTGGRFNLELDCYDESLKLAVEYNGVQHYKFVPYFHKNKEAFYNQKYRDDIKRRMCKDKGVNLIEVPNTVEVSRIEKFLINKLKIIGYLK
jgi:hypothetical protein